MESYNKDITATLKFHCHNSDIRGLWSYTKDVTLTLEFHCHNSDIRDWRVTLKMSLRHWNFIATIVTFIDLSAILKSNLKYCLKYCTIYFLVSLESKYNIACIIQSVVVHLYSPFQLVLNN